MFSGQILSEDVEVIQSFLIQKREVILDHSTESSREVDVREDLIQSLVVSQKDGLSV